MYGSTKEGDQGIWIEPREAVYRLTNFGNDVKQARVMVFLSPCGLSGDNSAPTAETVTRLSAKDELLIGFWNGVGQPGDSGFRFFGLGIGTGQADSVANPQIANSTGWRWPYGTNGYALHLVSYDGATRKAATGSNPSQLASYDPTAATNFAQAWGFNFNMHGTSAGQTASGALCGNTAALTDVSDANLVNYIYNTTFPYAAGAYNFNGWWGANGVGLNCPYFYIRNPFNFNRIRVHAMRVAKVQ